MCVLILVRFRGFQKLTSIDRAYSAFLSQIRLKKAAIVKVPLEEAYNRIIGKDSIAQGDIPPFDRSAVDGYALKARNIFNVSTNQPKQLTLVDKESVGENELKEIWTGNPLPKGADSVVMLEYTERKDDQVTVFISLTPGANVSQRGEDVNRGDIAVEAGTRLGPYHLGLLGALGNKEVEVVEKLRVALLATGDELAPLGSSLKPNQIVEVNSIIITGLCSELGAETFSLGIVGDNEEEIKTKICEGLEKADLIITTGGTSVGTHDLVPRVIRAIEPHAIVAHGIAMRPGMPTALAVLQQKPIIILSGNPVAAGIGFEVFARPTIQRLLGVKDVGRARLKAKLTRRVAGVLGRRVFLRVKVYERDGEFRADPVRVKGSGIITTMTKADGYVVIPEDREGLREDEIVKVHLFSRG